ncbi:MAG: sigma-70 family RNA polymerase sigma factor [Candidatus Latescibacteria bacterium]|nr:sigma-70 family RNA polymerase sigma factor [Candidatus Latescibacterota bacterium]
MKNNTNPKYLNDDAACVIRAQKAETSAYQALYNRYKHRLLGYIRLRVDCKDDARDILARTLNKAFANLQKIKQPQYFKQWIFKIALREISNYHRAQKTRIQATSVEDVPEIELAHNPKNNSLTESVRDTLKYLTNQEQDIINYRLFQKKEISEIADITGLSNQMIYYTLKKALNKFGDMYKSKYKLGPEKKEGEKNEAV